jgi:hypothetical protein
MPLSIFLVAGVSLPELLSNGYFVGEMFVTTLKILSRISVGGISMVSVVKILSRISVSGISMVSGVVVVVVVQW